MADPVRVTVGPLVVASANNICTSQTPGAAGALTLNGTTVTSGVATLDKARRVLITAAANETGHSFVLTGTDRYGIVISETLAGPNTTTVQSVLDYLTITKLTISAAATGALTVGTSGVASSAYIWLNRNALPVVTFQTNVTGTINYTVESTLDDLQNTSPALATWIPHPNIASKVAATQDNYAAKPEYTRLTVNSQINPALATLTVVQAGLVGN